MQNNLTEQEWRHHTGASTQYIRPELLKVVEREESIRLKDTIKISPERYRDNFVSHTINSIKTIVYIILAAMSSKNF